uniref:Neopullulanase-like enzyme n=1 Tax=uncultured microorganism TaxID=358574 RepID=A7LI67_9ZZZZ|nr:neopullulanase-like enzyme [uncultured microorganism]
MKRTHCISRAVIALSALLALVISSVGQESASPVVPAWSKKAVWYQIFPERFRNGDRRNDPKAADAAVFNREWSISPWTSDWYKLQPWEKKYSDKFYDIVFDRRYGGDFQGIIFKLPYLKELGINAIYFNPIFEANSLHKYNTSNFIHIDHNFGPDPEGDLQIMARENPADPATWQWTSADKLFLAFLAEAHKLGMKVIIDGVFNHVGTDFWAFKDVVHKQESSRYKNWFVIKRWDDPATKDTSEFDYDAWWGVKSLPAFRKDPKLGLVQGPRDHVFEITRRWMAPNGEASDGVDGWRLDVPNEIPHVFWKDWRRLVKGINPEAYIVGEIWDDATPWLQGDEFDAVMNYEFARAVAKFFINKKERISPTQFDSILAHVRRSYPAEVNYGLQNLIDSHDTDRLPSMIINPDRRYDAENSPRWNPNYDVRKPTAEEIRRQKLIVLFQLTYVGAPMIYYGSEAGMWGADDPDDRKPMLWEDLSYEDEVSCPVPNCNRPADKNVFNRDLFDFYRKLIRERIHSDALTLGEFQTRVTEDNQMIYVFERKFQDKIAIVGFNLSDQSRVVSLQLPPGGGEWIDLLNSKRLQAKGETLEISLEPGWGVLITKQN